MNLALYRSRIATKFGLSNVAGSEDQIRIDSWVNEGRDQLLALAKLHVEQADATLETGTSTYDLSNAVVSIVRMRINGRRLDPWSIDEINRANEWQAGLIRGYCLLGTNFVAFAGQAVDGDVINFQYVPLAATMTSGTNDPSEVVYGAIPPELHPAIESYVKWKAADWDDHASSQGGLVYKAEWQEALKAAKAFRIRLGGRTRPFRVRSRALVVGPGVDDGTGWGG